MADKSYLNDIDLDSSDGTGIKQEDGHIIDDKYGGINIGDRVKNSFLAWGSYLEILLQLIQMLREDILFYIVLG